MIYEAEVETKIAGIPCIVGVRYFRRVEGSFSYNAASDMDYNGYTECEYDVLDRKGYKALWLERKITGADEVRIEDEIAQHFAESAYDF